MVQKVDHEDQFLFPLIVRCLSRVVLVELDNVESDQLSSEGLLLEGVAKGLLGNLSCDPWGSCGGNRDFDSGRTVYEYEWARR